MQQVTYGLNQADFIVQFTLRQSDGLTPITGLAYNTAGLSAYIATQYSGQIAAIIQQLVSPGSGNYEIPTSSSHIRFGEIGQGVYEMHLHTDWLTSSFLRMIVTWKKTSGMTAENIAIAVGGYDGSNVWGNVQIASFGPLPATSSTPNTVEFAAIANSGYGDAITGRILVNPTKATTADIVSFDETTGVATISDVSPASSDGSWTHAPDPGDLMYVSIMSDPWRSRTRTLSTDGVSAIATAILGALTSAWQTAGTIGRAISDILSRTSLITSSTPLQVVAPVVRGGSFAIVKGTSYSSSDWSGGDLSWYSADWPDLTGASVVFVARLGDESFSTTATVVTATGTRHVRLSLTATQTALTVGPWRFSLVATLSGGNKVALVSGTMHVREVAT